MCGIFGVIATKSSDFDSKELNNLLKRVAKYSETRGKDSSGVCIGNDQSSSYHLLKALGPVTNIFKDSFYKENLEKLKSAYDQKTSDFVVFGHSRLVTNGSQLNAYNNQPVHKDDILTIHNGIITNETELWSENKELNREFEIDTEILPSLLRKKINQKNNIPDSFRSILNTIEGTVSSAFFFQDMNEIVLTSNNGSLYLMSDFKTFLVFASEKFMIEQLKENTVLQDKFPDVKAKQIRGNSLVVVNTQKGEFTFISGDDEGEQDRFLTKRNKPFTLKQKNLKRNEADQSVVIDPDKYYLDKNNDRLKSMLVYRVREANKLKRCTRCILPETFPFIEFDEKGVCNYCNNYIKKNEPKPLEELKKLVEPYKSKNGQPDCLVPFSGGRDSTFVLHFVKEELGLNPIAYTYDWGMVTDLARRNIARVCGKLGVENIIVAADINKKRRNIRLNIEAWLKRPKLGMIPLFMAGDKQFFKYANQVKEQANIDLNIWGINFLENTDFKVGFCGVKPDWNKEMIYSMSAKRKYKLFSFVGGNFLKTPSYLNKSLIDTFDSFLSRYLNPRKDYYHFFDFYQWDESEIESILFEKYNWETAKDLESTWRIGDGTASFYNYIYYTVAGFSEFDTFRSNQIREGMISREEALKLVELENVPRYNSLRWYIEIIGLDFEKTIKKINNINRLY